MSGLALNQTNLASEHARARMVTVHRLVRKFVDDERSVPEDAKDVLYYTLSVGHHTGVIDCFERVLSMPVEDYEAICASMSEGEARYKLEGVMRHSEIELGKSQVNQVISSLSLALSDMGESPRRFAEALLDQLVAVHDEPSVYVMIREVVA